MVIIELELLCSQHLLSVKTATHSPAISSGRRETNIALMLINDIDLNSYTVMQFQNWVHFSTVAILFWAVKTQDGCFSYPN